MLQNISVFHFLIFAVTIGFISAIVYTNIQRTALSKFIKFLITNSCNTEQNAASLDEIGLSAAEKRIVASSVSKAHGLKRSVSVVVSDAESDNKLERIFENRYSDKYFISCNDTESLLKKYSFKTMPTKLIVAFIAALTVVVFAVTAAVDWLISYVSIPKIENSKDKEIEQTEEDTSKDSEHQSQITSDAELPSADLQQDGIKPTGPRIPV